jgi:hypothetical protein
MSATPGIPTLIRNLLKAHQEPLRKAEIRDLIGLSGANGYGRVNNAIRDLVRRGEVEKSGHGRYKLATETKGNAHCKKQTIMWRFMWIRSKKSEPFTVREIFEMTGVSLYTAKPYVTFLKRKGFLYQSGRKKTSTAYAPLYLVDPEKMQIEAPALLKRREINKVEMNLDRIRELAARFYYTADTKPETLHSLMDISTQINRLLTDCIQSSNTLRK